jgi:predicted small metal-binding protein
MARMIRCECGYIAHGDTDDEVVDSIRDHMRADHPALFESVDRSEVYGWIQVE